MLLLLRHGESTGNADGLLLGRTEVPLTARGTEQARAAAAALQGVSRVVSSPLGRARQTAAALGLGLPVEIDERWVEVDYGELDGCPLADVPGHPSSRWRTDPNVRPPGGESLAEVGVRVRQACEELFAVEGEGARGAGHVVVVSHVSPIKAATCWAVGLADQGARRLYLATASITRIGYGPGGAVLLAFNETRWSAADGAPFRVSGVGNPARNA